MPSWVDYVALGFAIAAFIITLLAFVCNAPVFFLTEWVGVSFTPSAPRASSSFSKGLSGDERAPTNAPLPGGHRQLGRYTELASVEPLARRTSRSIGTNRHLIDIRPLDYSYHILINPSILITSNQLALLRSAGDQ